MIPDAWKPYAKAIVAAVGAILAALVGVIPADWSTTAETWLRVAITVLTALGVYAVPNTPQDEQ